MCRRRIEEEERDRERKREEKVRRREERRQDREERRRLQKLEAKRRDEEQKMQQRIAVEERKILIAQRKLETIRLLSELFTRIKVSTAFSHLIVPVTEICVIKDFTWLLTAFDAYTQWTIKNVTFYFSL